MALFGKKKRSIDELVEDIAELSEDEKSKLLAMLNGENQAEEQPVEEEPVEEVSEEVEQEETVEEPVEEVTEEEPIEEEMAEEEPVEEMGEEEAMEIEQAMEQAPTETPEPIREEEQAQPQNYDDVIAAQQARISSLESMVAELKETVERVVANQDNKNFGASPRADFSEDMQTSRRDAIFQSYAPRRYDQYNK